MHSRAAPWTVDDEDVDAGGHEQVGTGGSYHERRGHRWNLAQAQGLCIKAVRGLVFTLLGVSPQQPRF